MVFGGGNVVSTMTKIPVIFNELFNDPAEVHSFVLGVHCGITKQNYKDLDISDDLKNDVKKEYPYYLAGYYGAKLAKFIKRFKWNNSN